MNEKLTEEEYAVLCDALDDGFPDMIGRRNPKNRKNHGSAFPTNPLGEEITYFMPYEMGPSTIDQKMRQAASSAVGGVYRDVDTDREYFAILPFGFNLPKLKAFFATKAAEAEPRLRRMYDEYLRTGEPCWDNDTSEDPEFCEFDERMYSYGQWEENVLVPYSKIWFETEINHLIRKVEYKENSKPYLQTKGDPSFEEYYFEVAKKAHFLLGRMVEQYKWKFRHEATVVRRQVQLKKAGTAGGSSSKTKRTKRLEAFMCHIEALAHLTDVMTEDRILAQAWDDASNAGIDMPKTPKVRFDYEVQLRSIEPFKARYQLVFKKTA